MAMLPIEFECAMNKDEPTYHELLMWAIKKSLELIYSVREMPTIGQGGKGTGGVVCGNAPVGGEEDTHIQSARQGAWSDSEGSLSS